MLFKKISSLALNVILLFYITYFFLSMDNFYTFDRFNDIGVNKQGKLGLDEYIRQTAFVFEYLFAIAIIFIVTKLKKIHGISVILILWLLIIIELVAHKIYGRPADIFNISTLNASITNINSALHQYTSIIFRSTIKSTLLFFPLLICVLISKHKPAKLYSLVTLALLLTLFFVYGLILVKRGAPALVGFPKGFSYGFGSLYIVANNAIKKENHGAEVVPYIDQNNGNINNIIVIIDESVEYGEFIKQFDITKTNYIDYGSSFSGANCSASSNYIIRKGYWDRKIIGDNLIIYELPSLFELAKKRGFKTTYIDSQQILNDKTIRNYFDNIEISYIDSAISNGGLLYERDVNSLKVIEEVIKNGRNFIIVNKIGAHFPYSSVIHPSAIDISNSKNYERAVKENTVNFLYKLDKTINEKSISFYTSDHGQNLHTTATHCNTGSDATIEEYKVPFLVNTKNKLIFNQLNISKNNFKSNFSHLEFSESIRNTLGFKVESANSIYRGADHKQFFCGLYGQPFSILGVLPKCKILAQPISPPDSPQAVSQ